MLTLQQLEISTCKGLKTISLDNIIRIQASSNYCKIFLKDEYPITVAKVLRLFEEQLNDKFFCRINRSNLINQSFITTSNDKHTIKLTTGETFLISRRRRRVVKSHSLMTA